MRLISAAAVFAVCTVVGFMKGAALRRRVQLLTELRRMVTELAVAIRCTAPTLDELAEDCCGVFGELLRHERRSAPDLPTAWELASQRLGECAFCGAEERSLLLTLGRELGTCSAEGQLRLLELHNERLTRLLSEAEESSRSKGKLFRSVGALLGAGAAVMIV